MFKAVNRPAVVYDLVGLASLGLVTVGRETSCVLRLDCPEIPFLLSRRHATLQQQPSGKILLNDLKSTNGTYAARALQPLQKLVPDQHWELKEGDTISFGGPEVIVAKGEHVPNPFIFRFCACYDDMQASPLAQAAVAAAALAVRSPCEASSSNDDDDVQVVRVVRGNSRDAAQGRKTAAASHGGKDQGAAADSDSKRQRRPASSPSNVMATILAAHLSCPICQDWLVACHTLSCGHMFCGLCLTQWLDQNQTCPSCRKAVAGVPVRCFQVDSTINDLLDQGVNVMSPSTKRERRQKQDQWDNVQETVVPDWALSLNNRKHRAAEAATRHNRGFAAPAPAPAQAQARPSHRLSEHGAGPNRGA